MISKMSCRAFGTHIIAQADNDDYTERGYVAAVVGEEAAISYYGHCSCYDTWEAITEHPDRSDSEVIRDVLWDWTGTVDQLIDMANRNADPDLPGRIAQEGDEGYAHLIACYAKVLEWAKSRRTT